MNKAQMLILKTNTRKLVRVKCLRKILTDVSFNSFSSIVFYIVNSFEIYFLFTAVARFKPKKSLIAFTTQFHYLYII